MNVRMIAWGLGFAWLVACSGGTKVEAPKIELDPAKLAVPIDEGQLTEDAPTYLYKVKLANTGDADLLVAKPVLAGCSAFALAVTTTPEPSYPATIAPKGSDATRPQVLEFSVTYTLPAVPCDDPNATVTITSNDATNPKVVVTFTIVAAKPAIDGQDLDMGYVPEGQSASSALVVNNIGAGKLSIPVVRYTGSEGFSFSWPCKALKPGKDGVHPDPFAVTAAVGVIDDKVCLEPLVIPGNNGINVDFKFGATCSDPAAKCPPPATANLTFVSNDTKYDATKGEGLELKVSANVGGKCVQAQPNPLDFKSVIAPGFAKLTLNLFGCGDKDVTITALGITAGTPDPSDFDYELAAGQALPLTLHPNAKIPITIKYKPESTHKDPTGHFQTDTATLVVTNDSPVAELKVPLTALPIEAQCAVADFKATVMGALLNDNDTIDVQSDIKFIDTSFDATPGGAIVAWAWAVVPPPGSADIFTPSPTTQNVYFTANVVGDYTFSLTATNKFGCENTKTMHLKVPAPQGCHVQLTWSTPLDPDQTDQCGSGADCGSDMDLHVVHPAASTPGVDLDHDGQPDGFFDVGQNGGIAGDCFWFNPHPCWVQDKCSDPNYQPSLDRDDTDGAGPENFTYVIPQDGKCYKIGVHYWDDHSFGASYPTVRVWIDANKLYENAVTPKMKKLDMWEVGEVCCSAQTFNEFKASDGSPVVIHNYVNPDFNFTP